LGGGQFLSRFHRGRARPRTMSVGAHWPFAQPAPAASARRSCGV
jgi:hypothetical protein